MMPLKFLYLTWEDVQHLVEKLALRIQERGFNPEVVVAIGRGGFIPARVLCDFLDIHELASIGIRYYRDVGKRESEPRVLNPVNTDVRGRLVLIVDDVSDSGRSLQMALSQMLERDAKEVRIATLHHKPRSILKPDFFVAETESWVIYPWEILETARGLIGGMRKEGLMPRQIEEQLLSIGFKEKDFKSLLEDV